MFTLKQKKIFFACFCAYTCAYITRLNFSAALPAVVESLSLENTQMGLIQTLNALLYAGGQLFFGTQADRLNAKKLIPAGLILTALFNLLFAFSSNYVSLLIFWCLNGVAQSMLWTPIVTLISSEFEGKARDKVAFALSMSLIAGHLLAWGFSSLLVNSVGWRFSFGIPACIALMGSFVFMAVMKNIKPHKEENIQKGREIEKVSLKPKALFLYSGLLALLFVCILNGFIRDGVINWAPTILGERLAAGESMGSWLTILIIPLLNLMGILIGRRLYQKAGSNARQTITLFYFGSITFAALLFVFEKTAYTFITALLLGACCAAMYGINPIMTTIVPMEYAPFGKVGTVAGLIDSFIYVGSALSGIITSIIQANFGWSGVFFSWIGVSLLALGLSFTSGRQYEKFKKENQTSLSNLPI